MGKNKLKFEPMDSPKLNETFNSKTVENPEKTYEYLLSLGIHEDFIEPLNNMFDEIKASTAEIMGIKPEIIAANNRINKQIDISKSTKTKLAINKIAS